jgi:hypothetical protein
MDPIGAVPWANKSCAAAEDARTKYCVRHGSSCDPPSADEEKSDPAYIDVSLPLIGERLQKAGVRLAHLFDSALGN